MKPSPVSSRRPSPALRFRVQIEQAAADGLAPDEMMLRLTLGDASLLKRDPNLALTDISFAGGTMRFLGVKIEQGGVVESELVRP
jgi:hypothetical protein